MAATSRKPPKDKVGKQSKARPLSASKPSRGSQDVPRGQEARRASLLLKHVSDPTRIQIILILAFGEQEVGNLCNSLSQSQLIVSRHLALLRHGGMIAARREGAKHYYGLTDVGHALAAAVQRLLDDGVTDRPVVRPRSPRATSSPMQSPRAARKTSTDLPEVSELRSDRPDGVEEESWSRMNRRRAELIFKKNRGHLEDAERPELEHLQALSRSRMQREFPGPTLIDEKLKKIEVRLRGDGVEET